MQVVGWIIEEDMLLLSMTIMNLIHRYWICVSEEDFQLAVQAMLE